MSLFYFEGQNVICCSPALSEGKALGGFPGAAAGAAHMDEVEERRSHLRREQQ